MLDFLNLEDCRTLHRILTDGDIESGRTDGPPVAFVLRIILTQMLENRMAQIGHPYRGSGNSVEYKAMNEERLTAENVKLRAALERYDTAAYTLYLAPNPTSEDWQELHAAHMEAEAALTNEQKPIGPKSVRGSKADGWMEIYQAEFRRLRAEGYTEDQATALAGKYAYAECDRLAKQ